MALASGATFAGFRIVRLLSAEVDVGVTQTRRRSSTASANY
jgi:hypothetical protein